MFSLSDDEQHTLTQLGERLRSARRGYRQSGRETQVEFAARIGVSAPTYRKMEKGDGSVPTAYWIRALSLLDRLDEINGLLQPARSLFDEIDRRRR